MAEREWAKHIAKSTMKKLLNYNTLSHLITNVLLQLFGTFKMSFLNNNNNNNTKICSF